MRILAIDPGERRLGIAVSDPTGFIAVPLEVIERAGWTKDLARLRHLVEIYQVTEFVVGRPHTAAGTVGPQAKTAARFAERLRAAINLPVAEVDERYTTAAAERSLREGGARRQTRRGRRDAVAAALILQPLLDRARHNEPLRGSGGDAMLAP
jgi:putative Holliday junction resolvase